MRTEKYELHHGDCREVMATMPDNSVDAIVTDPPYAEVNRPYGRLTENQWHDLMDGVIAQCRRILKPSGSAVFILQPNSERVGRMRPWLWEFMAKWSREWNMVQDAWWWNPSMAPTVHCQRKNGLMRPSVKACVWLGSSECYRNQDGVLWEASDSTKAASRSDRALRKFSSGLTMRYGRCVAASDERGGTTPFNLLPIGSSGVDSQQFKNERHPAKTPDALCHWWVRYLTPPDGVVLDPFMGSGSTGKAAMLEGFRFIGIERESEYLEIARARIEAVQPALVYA